MNGTLYLMDYVQGWPITTNPAVIENHPFVKHFAANSGGLDAFNFDSFKELYFQEQEFIAVDIERGIFHLIENGQEEIAANIIDNF